MTTDGKHDHPGLHPRRLATLMRRAVERCRLDLSGRVVLTEAASGAYVVTPVLAAMAGARRVHAITRSTAHGTVEEVTAQTLELAAQCDVAERIEITTRKSLERVAEADIVTNSGHVRPLDAETISWMKPGAVVPLMYEAWEYRPADLDLNACQRRGIAVAGTNEQHPAVGVFPYLGLMAIRLLLDAGIAVQGSHLLVLCDNPFGPYLASGLRSAGAEVALASDAAAAPSGAAYDAVVVALRPGGRLVIGGADAVLPAREVVRRWPTAVVAQFWGDIDRDSLSAEDVPYWPLAPVPRGHMGILPSALGPEPVVRLQCGGLKVAELLTRGADRTDPYHDLVQLL
jgi:hypothetical protein